MRLARVLPCNPPTAQLVLCVRTRPCPAALPGASLVPSVVFLRDGLAPSSEEDTPLIVVAAFGDPATLPGASVPCHLRAGPVGPRWCAERGPLARARDGSRPLALA